MAKAIGNVVQKHTVLARCGKSCHSQWLNHLSPNLKNGAFTLEEEWLIIELHVKMGNKWARITAHFRKVKEAIDELSRAIAFKTDLHFWATFHKRIGDVMGRCATVELLSSLTPIIMRCLNFIFVSTPRKLELKNASPLSDFQNPRSKRYTNQRGNISSLFEEWLKLEAATRFADALHLLPTEGLGQPQRHNRPSQDRWRLIILEMELFEFICVR